MTWGIATTVLASVLLSALAQLVLKMGVGADQVGQALKDQRWLDFGLAALGQPFVVGGLFLYFASAVVWLAVLTRVPLSVAYPFVGLGFVLTLLFGWLVLGESPSAARLAGTLLIIAGVVLVGRSV
jgi:drug/metabolite transporter (DMT)-like permease